MNRCRGCSRSTFLSLIFAVGVACGPPGDRASEPEVEPGPRIVQPGAPGEETRVLTAQELASLPGVTYGTADVRFMREMIAHHAQAIEMVELVEGRSGDERIHTLAERIDISQADEIASMGAWLRARDEEASVADGGHAHAAGMLTPAEMDRLAAASGAAFDRLFLTFMIRHHEGALTMVRDLMASPGAAQEPEVFAFASEVEGDQRMEIERMQQLLGEIDR